MISSLKSDIDVRADENLQCRKIAKEIIKFGVSQRQIMFIIYLLGLELLNIEFMREVTMMIRTLSPESFVSNDS